MQVADPMTKKWKLSTDFVEEPSRTFPTFTQDLAMSCALVYATIASSVRLAAIPPRATAILAYWFGDTDGWGAGDLLEADAAKVYYSPIKYATRCIHLSTYAMQGQVATVVGQHEGDRRRHCGQVRC